MKGVVFNLLEEFIVDGWGDETYEEIMALCPLKTKEPFVGPGTYPDADLITIATKTAEKLGLPLADALRSFGKFCFPRLAAKVPNLVEEHTTPRSFLVSVHSVIHVEVRKLMPQAVTPEFTYEDLGDGALVLRYRSNRRLCSFLEGLLDGLSEHFATPLVLDKKTCMHEGAPTCDYRIAFGAQAEQAA